MIGEDNRKNLESTARIIKRANISKDFALVFAVCNSLEEQENYVEELRQTCNKQDIVLTEVKLLEIPPIKRLFPVIKEHLEKKFGDTLPAKLGIQVTGLELSILLDEDEQVPVVLQVLNMNRESFYKDLPFPFVFWLPEYACIKVANAAPDFWSFRLATPTFCSDDITGRSLPENMENSKDITVWQDKLAQIPVLERLLSTPQSTPVRVNLMIKSGEAYSYIGKTENARQRFEKAIDENEKANEDPQWAAEAYNKLGIIYSDMGVCKDNLEKAETSLQKYLEIVERAGRKDLETMGYNHLGLVYDKQKEFRKALRSYKEALEISRKYGHRKAEGDVLGNMGLLYRKQIKYEDALKMHQHALTISRELDDIQSEALDLSNIGLIYYEKNEHKHAADYFNQALFRNHKTGNKLEEMNQLIHLGDAWKALGDFSTALEKYRSAKAIAEEFNIDIFIVFDRLTALFGPGAIDDTAGEISLLKEAIEKSRQLRETARILCYLGKMCSVYRNQNQVTEKNNCLMKMEGILRNNIQQTENEDELRGYYEELVKIYKELGKKRELKTCRHKLGRLNDRQLIAWLDPGTVDMLDIDNQPVLQVGKTYNLNFQIVRTPPKQPLIYQGKIPPFKKVQKKSHIREVSPIEGRRISEEEARHSVPDKKSDEMFHEKNAVYSHEQDYRIPSEHHEKTDKIRYPSPTPYMSEPLVTPVSFSFTSLGIGFDREALDVLLSGNNTSDMGSIAITPKSTGDHRISVRVRVQTSGYKHDIEFHLQAAQQEGAQKFNIHDLISSKSMAHQVFISYANDKGAGSNRDPQVAEEIYNVLKAKNIPCWMAPNDIPAGTKWDEAIIEAVKESKLVVLVFSSNANQSEWVKDEINLARNKKITIIPFRIENVTATGVLEIIMLRYQCIDAFHGQPQDYIDKLVKDVQKHLETEPGKAVRDLEVNEHSRPIKEKIQEPVDIPEDVKVVQSKCKKVYKNNQGFWEADYGDDIIMVYIPPGEFTMGSNEKDNEKPPHTVFLDGYWMGKYEVTFAQYDKYWEETGKKKPDDYGWGRENRPVIDVSWDEAAAYCEWLSGKTGLKFKLPTEAQWEKAARGIDGRKYPWGNDDPNENLANFNSNNRNIGQTHPVGSHPQGASPYGLLDMAGNVLEWCHDWYDEKYYSIKFPPKNPKGPQSGPYRILRGGGWYFDASQLRCTFRNGDNPFKPHNFVGFRLCQDI